MLVLGLILVSYLLFVFFAEAFNPFGRCKDRFKKPHRRLGKAAAISSLVAGGIALLCLGLGERFALVVYLILLSIFMVKPTLRYNRTKHAL